MKTRSCFAAATAALVSWVALESTGAAQAEEPPAETTVAPPEYRQVPDETRVEETRVEETRVEERAATLEADPCRHARRRECTHFDLGLHGYLVSDTRLFGLQLGVGYEWFSVRAQVGPIINDGLTERFDTALLGPYFAASASGYVLRLPRFEARAGLGVMALWLASVSDELVYWAGTVGVAAAYYPVSMVGAFVELQVVPLSSEGLDLGYAPLLLQLGVEVTP